MDEDRQLYLRCLEKLKPLPPLLRFFFIFLFSLRHSRLSLGVEVATVAIQEFLKSGFTSGLVDNVNFLKFIL